MSAPQIERMMPDQWARVRAIRLQALSDAPDAFGTTLAEDEGKPLDIWRERLEHPAGATFLGTQDGDDVGLAVGFPWEGRAAAAGLFAMWVAPAARGSGVGDALVDAVVSWARTQGHAELLLEVANTNEPAIGLYARKGFERTGGVSTLPPPREHILEHERRLEL